MSGVIGTSRILDLLLCLRVCLLKLYLCHSPFCVHIDPTTPFISSSGIWSDLCVPTKDLFYCASIGTTHSSFVGPVPRASSTMVVYLVVFVFVPPSFVVPVPTTPPMYHSLQPETVYVYLYPVSTLVSSVCPKSRT